MQSPLTAQGLSRVLPGTSGMPMVMLPSTTGPAQVRGPSMLQHLLQVTLLNVNFVYPFVYILWVVLSCTTCVDRFVLYPCWASSKPNPNMSSYSVLVLQLSYWEFTPLKPTQREPAPSPSLCFNYNIIFGLNMQELKICSVFQATSIYSAEEMQTDCIPKTNIAV